MLKIINNKHQWIYVHKHRTGKISGFLNKLHEHLDLSPTMVLIILFCSKNTSNMLVEFSQKLYQILL
jgi:hypothetical protein